MKLIWLEIKKMFLQKNMLILVLIAIFVNGGKICINGRQDPAVLASKIHWQDSEIAETETELTGEISTETMKLLMDAHNQIINLMKTGTEWDAKAQSYYTVYPHYAYLYEYHIANQERIRKAEENILFYTKYGNNYDADVNRLFQHQYANRYVQNYTNSEDYAILFSYHFSSFILLVLSLVGAAQLVWKERKTGIYDLLQTTAIGKTKLHFAKMAAFFIWLTIVAAVLFGEDHIIHGILYHLEGIMQPLYSIESYQLCSFNGSILAYSCFLYGIRLLSAMSAGLVFVVLNTVFRGIFVPICMDIFFMTGLILTSEQTDNTFLFWNPAYVMQPDHYLKSFLSVRIGDHAISAMSAAWCTMTIMILSAGFIVHFLWSKNIKCTCFSKWR